MEYLQKFCTFRARVYVYSGDQQSTAERTSGSAQKRKMESDNILPSKKPSRRNASSNDDDSSDKKIKCPQKRKCAEGPLCESPPKQSYTNNFLTDCDSSSSEEIVIPKKKKSRKQRWTDAENETFKDHFKSYLESKTLPRGDFLRKAVALFPQRTAQQIRTRVHNVITGKQVL